QNSFSCAVCHLQANNPKDYVFRAGLRFFGASGGAPSLVFRDYQFLPNVLHVKLGSTITIYNDDVIAHTIVDDTAGFFSSMPIPAGGSAELRFGADRPFVWNFHCGLHNEKGQIIVE